jgi:hypothetical protein
LDGPVDTGREIPRIEPIAWPVSHEVYQKGETSFLRIIRKDAMRAA